MAPLDERRRWTETISKAVRRRHEGSEDSDPPPSSDSPHSNRERREKSFVALVVKKLSPWVVVATVLSSAGGYAFTAGRKSADIATKAQLDAVAAADMAVHNAQSDHLQNIDNRLTEIMTTLKFFQKTIDDQAAEIKELRSRPGMVVTQERQHGH